jgi:hypothetical protein
MVFEAGNDFSSGQRRVGDREIASDCERRGLDLLGQFGGQVLYFGATPRIARLSCEVICGRRSSRPNPPVLSATELPSG